MGKRSAPIGHLKAKKITTLTCIPSWLPFFPSILFFPQSKPKAFPPNQQVSLRTLTSGGLPLHGGAIPAWQTSSLHVCVRGKSVG